MNLRAILRVLIDAESWLYANQLKLQAKVDNPDGVVTDEDFTRWQQEWKDETVRLIQEQETDETTSNPSRSG